jgi:hypothetical protein
MSTLVAEIQKNGREALRVLWAEYEGHAYLDVRVYYRDGEAMKPTKKGATVRPDQVGELIAALQQARAVGRDLGLVTEPGKAA